MSFARRERAALCDLLLELGPDAPTLCEGWTAADLAAHLWLRESDPVAAPGIVVKQFAHVTARRMDAAKRKLPYAELVDRVRRGPGHFSLFALPGLDESANAIEFFVHHEDLRRAQAGEDAGLGGGVDGGGGVVENENAGPGEEGAGQGDALALPAGEGEASLADDGVKTVG